MSSIVTILSTDLITNSRADINNNFNNLNNDKIETSMLDTDTTLAANSDSRIATQKAVKAYVDAGGNVNASETAKGIVEEATDAEMTAGTGTGATGARLFVNPAKLATLLATLPAAPNIQTFTANGTWTKPTGARWVLFELIGAGGGSAQSSGTGAGGGGGGALNGGWLNAYLLNPTYAVTVGQGVQGANGGNTSVAFASGILANGGSVSSSATGGAGGTVTGGGNPAGIAGGNGGTASGSHGAGGGGAAGSNGTGSSGGTPGVGGAAGLQNADLGAGGNGGNGTVGQDGHTYGGGAGGGENAAAPSTGANGFVRIITFF